MHKTHWTIRMFALLSVVFGLLGLCPKTVYCQEVIDLSSTRPSLIIGGANSEVILGLPLNHVLGAGDTLYVLDSKERQVVAISVSGAELFRFGGPGAGPGEFSRPESITFDSNKVYITDSGLSRLIVFDSGGSYLRSFSLNQVPLQGLAVDGHSAYINVMASRDIVCRVDLDSDGIVTPILTWAHPSLQSIAPSSRTFNSTTLLAARSGRVAAAMTSSGLLAIFSLDSNTNDFPLVGVDTAVLSRVKESSQDAMAAAPRGQIRASPHYFNKIEWWAPDRVALEIRGDGRIGQLSTIVVVDIRSWKEVGPRIVANSLMHAFFTRVTEDLLAYTNIEDGTIELFSIVR